MMGTSHSSSAVLGWLVYSRPSHRHHHHHQHQEHHFSIASSDSIHSIKHFQAQVPGTIDTILLQSYTWWSSPSIYHRPPSIVMGSFNSIKAENGTGNIFIINYLHVDKTQSASILSFITYRRDGKMSIFLGQLLCGQGKCGE